MVVEFWLDVKLNPAASLIIILSLLAVSIAASVISKRRNGGEGE
jgi:hypothetical protein